MNSDDVLAISLRSTTRASSLDEDALSDLMDELAAVPGLRPFAGGGEIAPAGSKSVTGSWTEILIGLGAAGALLPTALGVVRDWVMRQPPSMTLRLKTADVEFEFSGTTPPTEIDMAVARLLASRS